MTFNLLCDECGHLDTLEGKMNESHIGHICVKCGADMLTRGDYEDGMKIYATLELAAAVMKPFGFDLVIDGETTEPVDGVSKQTIRFGAHNGVFRAESLPAPSDDND